MITKDTQNIINIYFYDHVIASLFSELLNSLKINNKILKDEVEIIESDYIITEPQFYDLVKEDCKKKCIIINDGSLDNQVEAITLSQPLSEKKIMAALYSLVVVN